MCSVKLNGKLLDQLIRDRFPRGISGLQALWDHQGGPDRTTIYRWRRGSLPKSSQDYLRLCGLLNVDPFCLLTTSESELQRVIDRITEAYEENTSKPYAALRFVEEFFGRKRIWPPRKLFIDHYADFTWYKMELQHPADKRRNYYETIEIFGAPELTENHPQVFHFAFRHTSLFEKRWLQYGIVVRAGLSVRLVHINGFSDQYTVIQRSDPTRVETFFGEGPAIFRIASLHPFTLRSLLGKEVDGRKVRFPG